MHLPEMKHNCHGKKYESPVANYKPYHFRGFKHTVFQLSQFVYACFVGYIIKLYSYVTLV